MTRSRSLTTLSVTMLATGLLVLAAPPASAGVDFDHTFSKGKLTLMSEPSGTLEVGCDAGNVRVNGELPPGGVLCNKVKVLVLLGSPKDDNLRTAGVNGADFPILTSITLDGKAGDDYFVTGSLKERVIGGKGSYDELRPGSGQANATLTNTAFDGDGPADPLSGIEYAELDGTAGADTLSAAGFSGQVEINGHAGDDTLTGGAGPDRLYGMGGSDTLNGGGGDDLLSDIAGDTSEGNDIFNGGPGNDTAYDQGTANMTITPTQLTGAGTNTHSGVETVSAATTGTSSSINASTFPGYAVMQALGSGSNTLTAGPGGSQMTTSGGADALVGASGVDTASLSQLPGGTVTNAGVTSSQGNDTFTSIDRLDVYGSTGNDVFNSSAFSGPVSYNHNFGTDTVTTGPANDSITTSGGAPVNGGGGTDTFAIFSLNTNTDLNAGGFGSTSLSGIEHFYAANVYGPVTFDASDWPGTTYMRGDDAAQTLIGSDQKDLILAGGGNDDVMGLAGNDKLMGHKGKDNLHGGPGKDTCSGGDGKDTLTSCEKQIG